MPRKSKTENDEILKKLKYINLDLENIPKELKAIKPIKYKTTRIYNKKQQYKQYRFIPINIIKYEYINSFNSSLSCKFSITLKDANITNIQNMKYILKK